jgi:poly(glycerol-phosphate) alpha-glucosyltransferase
MTPECNLPDGFAIGAALRLVHDGDGLAGGLEELVGMSEDQRKAMGMRGRKLVEERYTWGPIAEQMVQVYEWVLGRGQKPGCVVD